VSGGNDRQTSGQENSLLCFFFLFPVMSREAAVSVVGLLHREEPPPLHASTYSAPRSLVFGSRHTRPTATRLIFECVALEGTLPDWFPVPFLLVAL
jgi:hypothetical protein